METGESGMGGQGLSIVKVSENKRKDTIVKCLTVKQRKKQDRLS